MSHVYDLTKPSVDLVTQTIEDMVGTSESSWWLYPLRGGLFNKDFLSDKIGELKKLSKSLTLHFELGICLHPKFQGKRTGLSDNLYRIISGGAIFGWTGNPLIVAKHRKLFDQTFYFPLLGEKINTVLGLLAIVYTCASLAGWSNKEWENLAFGAATSEYFVEERGEKYIKLAKEFADKGSITQLDAKRIEYVLSRKSMAGAIMSIPVMM